MRSLIFIPGIILLLAGSCGTSKDASTTTNEPSGIKQSESGNSVANQAEQEEKMKDEMARASSGICRMIVSLISIGEGVDPKAHDQMDAIYNKWKDQGVQVSVEAIPWGREGEVDYCFTFRDLSDDEQAVYAEEMKKAFDGNTLVQITENEASRHKR